MSKVSPDYDMELDDEYDDQTAGSRCRPMTKKAKAILIGCIIGALVVIAVVVAVAVVVTNKSNNNISGNPDSPSGPGNDDPNNPAHPENPNEPVNPDVSPKITFNSNGNGGEDVEMPLAVNQRVTMSETPQFNRPNYAIVGWCTTQDCEKSQVAFPYFFKESVTLYAKWALSPKEILVSFDANTGVGNMPSQQYLADQQIRLIPNGFRKSSFKFKGWCETASCDQVLQFPHSFKDDVTLYPQWESISGNGKISFDNGDGRGTTLPLSCSSQMKVTEEMVGHSFEPPSREMLFAGYTIKEEASPSTRKTLEESPKLVTYPYTYEKEVTFVAVWKNPEYYHVKLIYNHSALGEQINKYTPDSEISDLGQPTLDDYLFAGWFTSKDFEPSTQVIFPIKISENNTVYYAKMIPYKIDGSISFNANGAFGSMVPLKYHKGVVVPEPVSQFRNPGYEFKGWYIAPTCNDDERVVFPLYFDESITIYPKWTLNIPDGQCLVVYHLGTPGDVIESQLHMISSPENPVQYYLPRPPTLERTDGSKFFGWTTDFGYFYNYFQIFSTDSYKVKGGFLHLYACYANNTIKINYNLRADEKGDVTPVYIYPDLVKNQSTIGLPYYVVTKPDRILTGWSKTDGAYPEYQLLHDLKIETVTEEQQLWGFFAMDNKNEGGNQPKYAGRTIWIKGIEPFPETRWVKRLYYEGYTIPWDYKLDHNKWWDAKKVQPHAGGSDSNYCWAASASNVLHWYFYHNSDYISRYFELHPDYPQPDTSFPSLTESAIFAYFKNYWPNEGNNPDVGIRWYFSGDENRGGGGFFKDVFTDGNSLIYETTRNVRLTRKRFNEFITQALDSDRAITWYLNDLGEHATTVYGAKYGDDGFISAIYYADNNHIKYMTTDFRVTSIIEAPIIYFDENVEQPKDDLETNKDYQKDPVAWVKNLMRPGYAIPVQELQSYSLRRDVWEKYFEEHKTN